MLRNRTTLGGVLLVALSCGALAQSQQYPQPQIKDSKLGKDNSHAQPPPTVNFPTSQEITNAIAAGIERANEKRETNNPTPPPDFSSWWFNFFLAIFTGLLVVVGGVNCYLIFWTLKATEKAANAATLAADVAKDTLIATQRPWVFVKLQLGQRGLFFMNEANLDLVFLLKNTGNSPAVAVRIEGSPRIDVTINDRTIELEQICSSARNRTPHPQDWGYTIFPGDTLTLPFIYTFANKEMLDKIVNEERGFIDPVVIGCVDYLFTFGEPIHHQSRFVYTVDYPLPQGGFRSINITEGDKASYLLRINPWHQARSFQAD